MTNFPPIPPSCSVLLCLSFLRHLLLSVFVPSLELFTSFLPPSLLLPASSQSIPRLHIFRYSAGKPPLLSLISCCPQLRCPVPSGDVCVERCRDREMGMFKPVLGWARRVRLDWAGLGWGRNSSLFTRSTLGHFLEQILSNCTS